MPEESTTPETLEAFTKSLSYGSRSDLTFKFMPRFEDTEIGDAVAALMTEAGALLDTGDSSVLVDLVISLQADGYGRRSVSERYQYDDGPFTAPSLATSESSVALLTSSGHFAAGDDPMPLGSSNMSQVEAEDRISEFLKEAPVLSEVPIATPVSDIQVRHGGYDVRGSLADHNVAFPIDRMREAERDGLIGRMVDPAYSFVGACAQTRLIKHIGPEWAERLKAAGSEVVLLVPV